MFRNAPDQRSFADAPSWARGISFWKEKKIGERVRNEMSFCGDELDEAFKKSESN